jgi:hypothetical protein
MKVTLTFPAAAARANLEISLSKNPLKGDAAQALKTALGVQVDPKDLDTFMDAVMVANGKNFSFGVADLANTKIPTHVPGSGLEAPVAQNKLKRKEAASAPEMDKDLQCAR